MSLIDDLNWRYATKAMTGEKVPEDKVEYILEAARLAPTSSGLQPFEITVVKDSQLLDKILPIANGQPQIAKTSHLLVFAAWDEYNEERINRVFARNNKTRGVENSATDAYRTRLLDMYSKLDKEKHFNHAARQAYIGFGAAIIAAAEQKVDATPMEGFNNIELDKLLGLNERGLRSVTILPLGYRDTEKDWLIKLKKVRTPKEEFITELV